ncbi:MAG: exo-alpha-sialidase [Chitinophagaceae bacterium]|nr:exo-alpha-sialidase [Chitinophagaceae bacterium]
MRIIPLLFYSFLFSHEAFNQQTNPVIIAKGQMPDIVLDKKGNLHIAYGTGDSIMYTSSKDGKNFTPPKLVAVIPGVFSSGMRGPQIAATTNGLVITASNKSGNIFSFYKRGAAPWSKAQRINEFEETAKEGLTDLSADGKNVYAVWLSVRKPKGQNLYGARSVDDGKTWQNAEVYNSPDETVCECCKPSVLVKGKKVYVMFRNWIDGNRDMYMISSPDNGKTFGKAEKLGKQSWKLNGCPMDGGGFAINAKGMAESIWQRAGHIYTSLPGSGEILLGEGRNGTIENSYGKTAYSWTDKGNIIVMKQGGKKLNIAKGSLPIIKAINKESMICVWQNDGQVYSSMINL